MDIINRTIDINGKGCHLVVTQPFGNGGGYHVSLDNYHHGQIVMNNGVWVAYLHESSEIPKEWVEWIICFITVEVII